MASVVLFAMLLCLTSGQLITETEAQQGNENTPGYEIMTGYETTPGYEIMPGKETMPGHETMPTIVRRRRSLCQAKEICQALETITCPAGWTENNHRCFKYITIEKSWIEAERHCIDIGGNLASIHSIKENDIIVSLAGLGHPKFWIGGYNVAVKTGKGLFSDGSKFGLTKWNHGEPNNTGAGMDCMQMLENGKWDDYVCYVKKFFMCATDL